MICTCYSRAYGLIHQKSEIRRPRISHNSHGWASIDRYGSDIMNMKFWFDIKIQLVKIEAPRVHGHRSLTLERTTNKIRTTAFGE